MSMLLVKMTLMPFVMVITTWVSRKWGNRIGGLVASLPWIAGPILLFFILEQGTAFGIRSVPGILTGILSLISFCYSYAQLIRRFNGITSLLLSYGVYLTVALLVNFIKLELLVVYALAMGSVVICLRYFPRPAAQVVQSRRLTYDLPLRIVAATAFVLIITGLASVVGPTWSGILTPFPIITSILAVFTHHLQGSSAAITILRGIVMGLLGFTTFLFLQAYFLALFPVGVSFGLALLINVAINVLASRIF